MCSYIKDDAVPFVCRQVETMKNAVGVETKVVYIALSILAHAASFALASYAALPVKAAIILTYAVLDAYELMPEEAGPFYDKVLRGLGRGLLLNTLYSLYISVQTMQCCKALGYSFFVSASLAQEGIDLVHMRQNDLWDVINVIPAYFIGCDVRDIEIFNSYWNR